MNAAVTVIMPVFNGERFLGAALESLLAQTFTDFTAIVIDDGSLDRTAEILAGFRDPRLQPSRNPVSIGPAAARNIGLERARSRYVAFFDSDDVANPRRLELQMAFLARHPEVGLLAGRVAVIDEQGRPAGANWGHEGDAAVLASSMLFRNCLATSTIVVDRALIANQRFDPTLAVASDYDMWLKLADRTTVACMPDLLASYRVHPSNLTHTRQASTERCLERILRRRLSRLGIEPSAAEMELHRRLGCERLDGSDAFMNAVALWLGRLDRANDAHSAYPRRPFRRVLQAHWLAACETAARERGWPSWPLMLQSSLLFQASTDLAAWGQIAHLPWRTAKTSLRHLWRTRAVASSGSN